MSTQDSRAKNKLHNQNQSFFFDLHIAEVQILLLVSPYQSNLWQLEINDFVWGNHLLI